MGVAPLPISPSDPLARFLLPVPMTLCSAVLVPKGGKLPTGDTRMISLIWKLRLPSSHFRLFMPLNEQEQKGVTVLAGVTDPDYQGEIGLLFHNGGKKDDIHYKRSLKMFS